MSIDVTVEGTEDLDGLAKDMIDAKEHVDDRIGKVMTKHGPRFVRSMEATVPVDTGASKRSLHFTVNKAARRLRVGSIKRVKNPKTGQLVQTYIGFVHDGTSRMGPRPFIRMAVEKHIAASDRFMRDLADAGVGRIQVTGRGIRL